VAGLSGRAGTGKGEQTKFGLRGNFVSLLQAPPLQRGFRFPEEEQAAGGVELDAGMKVETWRLGVVRLGVEQTGSLGDWETLRRGVVPLADSETGRGGLFRRRVPEGDESALKGVFGCLGLDFSNPRWDLAFPRSDFRNPRSDLANPGTDIAVS
jgi:hypothetical protein